MSASERQFREGVRQAETILASRGVELPPLDAPINGRLALPNVEAAIDRRLERWRGPCAVLLQAVGGVEGAAPGETAARAALSSAVDAFNYLEDTTLADRAHNMVHRVGEFVGGLYGCWLEYDKGDWLRTCPVVISHLRVGNSVGFTARWLCSICRRDVSDPDGCSHMPGRTYEVEATTNDGLCSICGSTPCDHRPGARYSVVAGTMVEEADLHETSLVARPRDPLCRCDAIEVSNDLLIRDLGHQPRPSERIRCNECIGVCMGFTSFEDIKP
jgi:hypothetical protein